VETAYGEAIAAGAPPVRRGWMRTVAVAVVSAVIGAGVAVGIILGTGAGRPTLQYNVSVFLDHDATAEQKAAIEAELPTFAPSTAVTFETREQAWQNVQEMAKAVPEILESATKDSLPESFRFRTEGYEFDCGGVRAVRDLPGVAEITVAQLPGNGYGAKITCI
jgi:cell division transport system permease protein